MNHAKAIGRLSILAVGLGIGIGTAATAAAAPTMPVDPVPVVPDLPLPAADIPGLDLSISFDGFSLFQSGAAEAETGTGDFAIAFGNDSFAQAGTGLAGAGTSDTAMAFGTDSLAVSGNGNLDTSISSGVSSFAEAGGGDSSSLAGNGDFAFYWGPGPSLDTEPSPAGSEATSRAAMTSPRSSTRLAPRAASPSLATGAISTSAPSSATPSARPPLPAATSSSISSRPCKAGCRPRWGAPPSLLGGKVARALLQGLPGP